MKYDIVLANRFTDEVFNRTGLYSKQFGVFLAKIAHEFFETDGHGVEIEAE